VATVDACVPGLRVRMGVASGVLDEKEECLSCRVLQVARVVSDAGSGGQVLLDSNTFAQIKDRCAHCCSGACVSGTCSAAASQCYSIAVPLSTLYARRPCSYAPTTSSTCAAAAVDRQCWQ
jgi:hypothetical protein